MQSDVETRLKTLFGKAGELIDRSRETDYIMPIIFPFLPSILLVIGVFLLVLGIFTHELIVAGFAVSVIAIIFFFYIVYKWIKRRNDHFKRSLELYEVIAEISEILGFKRSNMIRSRLNELRAYSQNRDAVVNTILIIVPFYIFYVYHFLNKDFVKHSQHERFLLGELFDEIRERVPSFYRRIEEFDVVPDRSTLLYVILTLVTSLFVIYWVYTLTKDPNKHFESHRVIERELLDSLKAIARQSNYNV